MNTRIYIEKKEAFDVSNQKLQKNLQSIVTGILLKSYIVYDIFNISEKDLQITLQSVFADNVVDIIHRQKTFSSDKKYFAVEYHAGQYDQRADSAEQVFKLITGNSEVKIQTGYLYEVDNCSEEQLQSIKDFIINKVDSQEKDLRKLEIPSITIPERIKQVNEFIHLSENDLKQFYQQHKFSFDFDDLEFIQQYFKEQEKRNPTETELKVLDTYWSDHCRHTTFLTELYDITFHGNFKERLEIIFQDYLQTRNVIGREKKPISLMDLATVCAKYFHQNGKLNDLVISDEINACTLNVTINVDGNEQEWELLFKNETHNHPTEIEPFGGASTCIGGAIRDPLSGRAFVYQAMRVTGSGSPLKPLHETLQGKLPQRKITQSAAHGYSSYGNQIGLPTSHISEIYHEGYVAKRMEVGMVVGAVPKNWVRREKPILGDKIIVLGGKTGRDGVGGATGSSKEHTEDSIHNLSAEVQKGDAVQERKIQRFFRNAKVLQYIKKCNDFGAGGLSVAIGEIADGVIINLNKFPTKYEGLNGTEIALSESQERMAVVVEKKDVEKFILLAKKENIIAVDVGEVTDENRLQMFWNEEKIVDISRDFLETSGIPKKQKVTVKSAIETFQYPSQNLSKENFIQELQKLNCASQKGLVEMFDSSVGQSTVLMPFGGKSQLTPAESSIHTFPVLEGKTQSVSMASWGFCPEISSWSQLHGGAYAVVESLAKLVASGANYKKIRLSFQEYFEKLNQNEEKWGKPLQSLLGAYEAQKHFELAAIGGKDSMSGTFNDIHVPPTLISFAVATGNIEDCISPEFKLVNHFIYLIPHNHDTLGMPNYQQLISNFNFVHQQILQKNIVSAKTIKYGGLACELFKMCIGNTIGAEITYHKAVFKPEIGSLIIACKEEIHFENSQFLGKTIADKQLIINNQKFLLEELVDAWQKPLEEIFPFVDKNISSEKKPIIFQNDKTVSKSNIKIANPKVLLPIFPGTNCEYETEKAFVEEGAKVESFIFNTYNQSTIEESINYFSKQLLESKILAISGGFSVGDEPDGSAKYIVSVLKTPIIRESIQHFLENDGLILGICNGFQALVKSGLLPYGKIKNLDENSPTLTFNSIGRHINQMARVKVVSDKSVWLQGMLGEEFTIPFSHGEGRFFANDVALKNLQENQLISTQYISREGNIALSMPENPNGSVYGIEGITDFSGKIYGRMGHPERYRERLMKNIPEANYMNIFKNGVAYFK